MESERWGVFSPPHGKWTDVAATRSHPSRDLLARPVFRRASQPRNDDGGQECGQACGLTASFQMAAAEAYHLSFLLRTTTGRRREEPSVIERIVCRE